jgi:hypothetical protein
MARTHGTRSCYNAGCKCEDCTAANTEASRQQRLAEAGDYQPQAPGTAAAGWYAELAGAAETTQAQAPPVIEPTGVTPPARPLVLAESRHPAVIPGSVAPADLHASWALGTDLLPGHIPGTARPCQRCRKLAERTSEGRWAAAVAEVEITGPAPFQTELCARHAADLRRRAPAGIFRARPLVPVRGTGGPPVIDAVDARTWEISQRAIERRRALLAAERRDRRARPGGGIRTAGRHWQAITAAAEAAQRHELERAMQAEAAPASQPDGFWHRFMAAMAADTNLSRAAPAGYARPAGPVTLGP